jgi:hypothetical protein
MEVPGFFLDMILEPFELSSGFPLVVLFVEYKSNCPFEEIFILIYYWACIILFTMMHPLSATVLVKMLHCLIDLSSIIILICQWVAFEGDTLEVGS